MFNLFKKKAPGIKIIDKVYISVHAKHKALLERSKQENNLAVIFWFEDSLREAETFFTSQAPGNCTLLGIREAASAQLGGKFPVFAEHYPLRSKEIDVYSKMNLQEVEVYSSLDEPVFQQFGGAKISKVMEQLGMKEEENIEHQMVTHAIQNMQEKMEKKNLLDQGARSQAEWLQKNYKA